MTTLEFKPKLFSTLRHYDRRQFTTDLLAGIIVGIVALPLAIAFGIGFILNVGLIFATRLLKIKELVALVLPKEKQ